MSKETELLNKIGSLYVTQSTDKKEKTPFVIMDVWREGELRLVAGWSGSGKSTYIHSEAELLSKKGYLCAIFDTENAEGRFIPRCENVIFMHAEDINEKFAKLKFPTFTNDDLCEYLIKKVREDFPNEKIIFYVDNLANFSVDISSRVKITEYLVKLKALSKQFNINLTLVSHCGRRTKDYFEVEDLISGAKNLVNLSQVVFCIDRCIFPNNSVGIRRAIVKTKTGIENSFEWSCYKYMEQEDEDEEKIVDFGSLEIYENKSFEHTLIKGVDDEASKRIIDLAKYGFTIAEIIEELAKNNIRLSRYKVRSVIANMIE